MAVFARMIIYNVQSLLQLLVAAAGTLASQGLLSHGSMLNGTLSNGTHPSHPGAGGAQQQSSSPEQVSCPASLFSIPMVPGSHCWTCTGQA